MAFILKVFAVLTVSALYISSTNAQRFNFTGNRNRGRQCTDKPIDLVFLLDSSWSLRNENNFKKELKFVSDVVTVLNWNKARVSVLTFSDSALVKIPFDAYRDLRQFQGAVNQIPWIGGNTYTDEALDLMLKEIRSNQAVRAGSGVMTMGVVITDGGSTNPYRTKDVIATVHRTGVEMFAIGVGQSINEEELKMIATDPDSQHYYRVDDLDGLETIKSMISSFFCETPSPTPPQIRKCQGKPVDLAFVLDSSWSLRSMENFQKELRFVSDVVNNLGFDFGESRLSVITFSDDAQMRINFGQYRTRDEFQRQVNRLNWIGGNTYTNKALEMMYDEVKKNQGYRARSDVMTVGVVITDGGSTDPYSTENVVRKIHSDGIQIFAIGVGNSINMKELEMMASNPRSTHLFMVDDLDGLKMLGSMLSSRICPDPNPAPQTTPSPPTPNPNVVCEQDPADIFFIIDKSSSLRTEINFQKELAFVMRVVDNLDIGLGSLQTRVGVISFSTNAMLEWGLSQYSSRNELESALLYVEFSRGDTYTHKAIDIMLDEFRNARRRVKQIGVIITDGQSTDPYSLKNSLRGVRQQGLTIFAIGVGDAVNRQELSDMASDPDDRYVSHVDNLDALENLKLEFGLKRCRPA